MIADLVEGTANLLLAAFVILLITSGIAIVSIPLLIVAWLWRAL